MIRKNRITLVLLAAIGGLGMFLYFYFSQAWLPRLTWERVRENLVTSGESLDPVDFMPVPLGEGDRRENFASAEIVRQWMTTDVDDEVPPLLAAWHAVESRVPESIGESDLQMIADLLEPVEPSLANLRSCVRFRHARFDFPREVNGMLVNTHPIEKLRSPLGLLKVIELDAKFQLVRREAGLALDDVLAMIRFSDLYAMEPGLLPFVLRLACVSHSIEVLERGVCMRAWDSSELDELEQALARFDPGRDVARVLRSERAIVLHDLQLLEKMLADDQSAESFTISPFFDGHWTSGLVWESAAILAEAYSKCIDLMSAERPLGERCEALDSYLRSLTEEKQTTRRDQVLLPMMARISGIGKTTLDGGRVVNLIRAAIAIESYRLEHGHLPEDLDTVEKIPLDPLDDRMFQYRLRDDGFLVEAHSQGNVPGDPLHFEDLDLIVPVPLDSWIEAGQAPQPTRTVIGPPR